MERSLWKLKQLQLFPTLFPFFYRDDVMMIVAYGDDVITAVRGSQNLNQR